MTKEEIKAELEKIAKENNYTLTNNVDRIINAKLRFFGEENWRKGPCVQDSEHAALSDKCRNQIETTGKCHCDLVKK